MAIPTLPTDPFEPGGIAGFGRRLRKGEISAVEAAKAYLARIEMLDPHLGAYEYVASAQALSAARGIDELLAAGTDFGPLMGVPVALKDLIAVDRPDDLTFTYPRGMGCIALSHFC